LHLEVEVQLLYRQAASPLVLQFYAYLKLLVLL
jgi:hypothetical protein